MAWENVLKKQSDRFTTLLDDAVKRWRYAKGKGAGFIARVMFAKLMGHGE